MDNMETISLIVSASPRPLCYSYDWIEEIPNWTSYGLRESIIHASNGKRTEAYSTEMFRDEYIEKVLEYAGLEKIITKKPHFGIINEVEAYNDNADPPRYALRRVGITFYQDHADVIVFKESARGTGGDSFGPSVEKEQTTRYDITSSLKGISTEGEELKLIVHDQLYSQLEPGVKRMFSIRSALD